MKDAMKRFRTDCSATAYDSSRASHEFLVVRKRPAEEKGSETTV